ncbi:MAG: T9SS type A sorting domain-containing protein [Bacteroidota bacterium]
MKRLILLLSLQLLFAGAFAQINFEHEYYYSGTFVNLSLSGSKFYVMDVENSQCRIYNLNHSLWKTIDLDIPADHYLYDIRFVSENLFTTDNAVALAYIYYHYDETGQYYSYFARIISENGTALLTIPGAQYLAVNDLDENGVKLSAYVYDYSVYPYTVKTRIYDLPGQSLTMPEAPAGNNTGLQHPFPNPARDFTSLPYELPRGEKQGTIILTDSHGILIQRYRVDRTFKHLRLNTAQLPAGTYFYYLETTGEISETKKLVVQ